MLLTALFCGDEYTVVVDILVANREILVGIFKNFGRRATKNGSLNGDELEKDESLEKFFRGRATIFFRAEVKK